MTADACRSWLQRGTSICANEEVDASAAHQFIEKWRTFTASCRDPVPNFFTELGRVLVGKLAVGESCTVDYECAPVSGKRVYCAFEPDGVTGGTCQIETAAAGEPCAWTCDAPGACEWHEHGAGCFRSEGMYCVASTSGPMPSCFPVKAAGEACTTGECASGLACLRSSTLAGAASTCAPRLAEGNRCSRHDDCQSGACVEDQCAPKQADGALCLSHSECASGMCLSLRCGLTGLCRNLGASLSN